MNVFPSFILLILILCAGCAASNQFEKVKTGAEVLVEKYLPELENRRVGLVMNPTARIGDVHVLDTLLALDVNVTALFSPEHGFRGQFSDGEVIKDGIDQQSGLPVFSLYGSTKKPTSQMLQNVDLLLFDMQDVGARFYTYNSTMRYVIEAASEFGVEVWILDRPNPAGGDYVAGWVLEDEFESFIGTHKTPVAHGMTLGELALMGVGEGWYELETEPNIKIIEMEGWNRKMLWPETGLPWYPPSPNLPTFEHAFVYLGTCFIEGTTISEGRGTDNPFLTLGAPDFEPDWPTLQKLSEKYSLGIDTVSFIPRSIPGKSTYPKHEDVELSGIRISMTDSFRYPVEFGVEITNHFMELSSSATYRDYMNLLAGYDAVLDQELNLDWGNGFEEFLEKREQYLLYE